MVSKSQKTFTDHSDLLKNISSLLVFKLLYLKPTLFEISNMTEK